MLTRKYRPYPMSIGAHIYLVGAFYSYHPDRDELTVLITVPSPQTEAFFH